MYSYPFGEMDPFAPPVSVTAPLFRNNRPTLQEIHTRNYLCCGITTRRPRFAETNDDDDATNGDDYYVGMDVEYCKLLLAVLFVGNVSNVD
jgi:hypothetical protein